jgi:hypothetical protein
LVDSKILFTFVLLIKKEIMIKRKATKKTVKKNLKKSYTQVAPNIYKDVAGSYCARKMVDGVRYCKSSKTIKEAKAYLNSL